MMTSRPRTRNANNLLGTHNDRLVFRQPIHTDYSVKTTKFYSLITSVIVSQFWAVSSKMSLSSALIATVALLIIIVVVALVVVVVVVVVVIVVGICRLTSSVSGQMANPLAVIAP
ncbi:hypothetical protein Tco_0235632, partial [Tanacetum coccineum]